MAAIFDLDHFGISAILVFRHFVTAAILELFEMCWWRFALVNRIVFYRVISVYRKTVMVVINGCNRLVTVLNIIMYGAFCTMVADI